ncbi:Ribosomal_L27-domain-containing protein [Sphaerulina musiva SO2202]|uniref:Large ribosomal subunit protein bL27m n=1 Tax=Sphaerulina musiva (strain SO2202) TaxID=692275 RepID=N1QET8_SPHMS|nr:Ribosomal_L27-domain-containing protein [Sphaerulina musiva SO2202]EMF11612.1 Ribosomal_L27-domain-containing protein [Sphaerulina musiva SO2202]
MASLLKSRLSHASSNCSLTSLESALASFRISPAVCTNSRIPTGRRNASHQAQGRANGAKDGPGKRLGAKKSGGQYVVPGNILFRQRGTLWFPGDNCYMGRDHTIHAGQPGYVIYYRDPLKHPHRKYIGIVFDRSQTLPQAPNTPRRRKLGMLAYQNPKTAVSSPGTTGGLTFAAPPDTPGAASSPATIIKDVPNASRDVTVMRGPKGEQQEINYRFIPGRYMYKEANWEIGRAAERSKVAMAVKPFVPGDRFAAWRKRNARKARSAERRALSRGGKKAKK